MSRAKESIPVVVDTREQQPYGFDPVRFAVQRCALPAGDYSIAGLELEVAIERKSLNDFVGTVIKDWDRFQAELQKLQRYHFAAVIVEASPQDVMDHQYTSQAAPTSILGRAISIHADFGIPVLWLANRQLAKHWAEKAMERVWERMKGRLSPSTRLSQ